MSNPYGSYGSAPGSSYPPHYGPNAQSIVQGPAIALIVVSSFAIICGLLALAVDAFLLASGAIAELEQRNRGGISEYAELTVRTIWGIALLIASSFVLYGAIRMKNLRGYGMAQAAAVVAMIPCLGPCCILGIPFGIWAFVVLSNPQVRSAFR